MSLEDKLMDAHMEGAVMLTGYDKAAIGTDDDGAVVYDYDLLIEQEMAASDCSYTDAVEYIDYNVVRAIPYMPKPQPVILYRFLED